MLPPQAVTPSQEAVEVPPVLVLVPAVPFELPPAEFPAPPEELLVPAVELLVPAAELPGPEELLELQATTIKTAAAAGRKQAWTFQKRSFCRRHTVQWRERLDSVPASGRRRACDPSRNLPAAMEADDSKGRFECERSERG